MNEQADFLKQVNILSSLSKNEINKIINYFNTVNIKKGEILFEQGDEGNAMYIVKEGKIISTIKLPDGKEQQVAEFGRGDFFGDMSIIEQAPRSATCKATDHSSLFEIDEGEFFGLMDLNPNIAIKIMHKMLNIITSRLRNANDFVVDMVNWGEDARTRAITDPMTGVYNRRYLDDSIDDFFKTAKKKNEPLSVVMIDLDYFRQINDNYGHDIGDKAIIEIVGVLKNNTREKDIIARYGGDEFTILLPETSHNDGRQVAQNICKKVANLDMLKDFDGPVKNLSLSMGMASFPKNAKSLKTLRAKADKALYNAKENGRNQVFCAT
ncbi:diguanylate cyclase [Spirochaetota bacterium]